jgi:hypothetical protein
MKGDNSIRITYRICLVQILARVSAVDANVSVKLKSLVFASVRHAVTSASSLTLAPEFRFSSERMMRAQMGLLAGRPSLEEGV